MIYSQQQFQDGNGNINLDVLAAAVLRKIESNPNRQQLTLPISFETVAVLKRALGLSIDPQATAGTVSSVAVTTANGVSAVVTNPYTNATLAFTLGNITPTTVNALTFAAQTVGFTIAGGTTSKTLTVADNATVSGTNTGDQDLSNYLQKNSVSGTFTTVDGKTITVTDGQIVSII